MAAQSQWPSSGAAYGPSASGLQPTGKTGAYFTRSAPQATEMRQREQAYVQQHSLVDPAMSPLGLPARSGRSTASFSFRRQHSRVNDGSWTDSTSSSTTSSGHCCVCNAASDADLIPRRKRSRREKSDGDKPKKNFSWATCVPVVSVTVLAASLFLFGISTLVRSRRVPLSLGVTQHIREGAHSQQKGTSRAVASSSDALVEQKLVTEEKSSEDTLKADLSPTTEGTSPPSTTPVLTVRAKTVAPGLKRKHSKRAKKTSPKKSSRNSKVWSRAHRQTKAIPLRQIFLPECSYAFYTFCQHTEREYYYQPDADTCYETNAANVCTRGTNRFATLEHCVHSCVSTTHPADKCFGKPMFTRCARRDALFDWWYYDNTKCEPWSFPSGGCPANGSMVFATAKDCEKRCREPHRGPRCKPPKVVECGRRQLKYPYFAHVSPEDGRMRCYRSSLATLRRHQCLVGGNRFRSLETCVATCRQNPPFQ
ncbi:hypothetical protein HPB50_002659 [Hyalomma asiaticum]|uniref:Uncharacterized protein n=1 Tax=Hyalomma asiaticum TaxID=266040 RepID=A0ACB7RWY5_HYAAI|nr:hypothetical protein HPB50_002659 [Hyalomma asiaticum]